MRCEIVCVRRSVARIPDCTAHSPRQSHRRATTHEFVLDARAERRDLLRGARGLAAGAWVRAPAGLGPSVAQASPLTFPIKIDATRLVYSDFVIPGVTGWVDSRTVQSVNLAPGEYSFQIASGYYADFTFRVTSQGTIDFNVTYNGFLSGRNTSTLTIDGLNVTLDARYLSGSGVLLVVPSTDWITYQTCRMVPASYYSVQQGSGVVANFSFKLGVDGNWSYAAALGGFLAGAGTSTLTFYGYPLLVDARAAGGSGVTVQSIAGMPFSPTSVEYANLLPARISHCRSARASSVRPVSRWPRMSHYHRQHRNVAAVAGHVPRPAAAERDRAAVTNGGSARHPRTGPAASRCQHACVHRRDTRRARRGGRDRRLLASRGCGRDYTAARGGRPGCDERVHRGGSVE